MISPDHAVAFKTASSLDQEGPLYRNPILPGCLEADSGTNSYAGMLLLGVLSSSTRKGRWLTTMQPVRNCC